MPLNGLRIAQTYVTSPFVSRDSFAPSPFPDELTQGDISQVAITAAAANTASAVSTAINGLATTVIPDDGIGPNTVNLNVIPTISGLKISWNGLDTFGQSMSSDFDHVDVYVSDQGGFVPSDSTRIGRFYKAGELYFFSNGVYQRYYVRGVAYDHAGNPSSSSNQISDQPRQIVGADITANTITANNIAVGSVTADRISTGILYTGTKIVVGTYTNNTARIEIDQQTGINLISRDVSGVDTTSVSLNILTGVGVITGGSIIGSSISTAMSPNSRIELKGGVVGVRDTLNFYPGSGVTGEQPGIISTNTSGGRQQITLQSPYDGTATQPCSILFQSSTDGSLTGTNGPILTLTSGTVQIAGDLQINGQSVARGLVGYTYVPGQTNGFTNGNEFAYAWFGGLIRIEEGRKYAIRWRASIKRSDSIGDLSRIRIRSSPTAVATTTGTVYFDQYVQWPNSVVGVYFTAEKVILGGPAGSAEAPNPGVNGYPTIPAGMWSFSITGTKNSGTGNSAMVQVFSDELFLEDIGT